MHKLLMMVHVVGSFLGYKLLRSLVVCRMLIKRGCGMAVEHERFLLGSIGCLWRHAIELDGVYRLHVDLARDGAFEVFWRHHSGVETPADAYPSLWQALVAMAPQLDHYLAFVDSSEWTTV